jgi:hypothetical protein
MSEFQSPQERMETILKSYGGKVGDTVFILGSESIYSDNRGNLGTLVAIKDGVYTVHVDSEAPTETETKGCLIVTEQPYHEGITLRDAAQISYAFGAQFQRTSNRYKRLYYPTIASMLFPAVLLLSDPAHCRMVINFYIDAPISPEDRNDLLEAAYMAFAFIEERRTARNPNYSKHDIPSEFARFATPEESPGKRAKN